MTKFTAAIILLISTILAGIYFGGTFYYKNRFPSNVYINDIRVGGMTLEKANKRLAKSDIWDNVTIRSDKEEFLEIKADAIDYRYIDSPNLPNILSEQNKWLWFLGPFKHSTYTSPILSNYNKDSIKFMIDRIEALDQELSDAEVVYSENKNAFVIQPHRYEIKLTKEQLLDLVTAGINKRERDINITSHIEHPPLLDSDELLSTLRNKANQYLNVRLTYDYGDREEVIDGQLIKDWITFNTDEVSIDPEKVREYVVELAKKYDTYGRARKFKTSSGKNIKTGGGTYGWVTHRGKTVDALIEHIEIGEDKIIKPIYSFEALIRNSDDIGNSYIEIDLEQQTVYLYINGSLKVMTETVTGNVSRGYNTPVGVYPLNYKETDAILTGEDYASPVQYWMPFNGNIGLHDANWRDTFGGKIYESKGSNGCVNLPPGEAKTIFNLVYPGMPVIVH